MLRLLLIVTLIQSVCSFNFTEQQILNLANNGNSFDNFGSRVGISGNTILVTAPFKTVGGIASQGAAYVYVQNGGSWTQQAMFTAVGDYNLGGWAGISGDTIVLGGSSSGQLRVYVRNNGVWTEEATIPIPPNEIPANFTSSLAIDGDTILAGSRSGRVYVFTRTNGVWEQETVFHSPTANSGFGYSVAIRGDTAVISATRTKGFFDNQGVAYVYVKDNGVWAIQANLTASDPSFDDYFGSSVAIDGDTIVVGSTKAIQYPQQGKIYIFVRDGSSWSQQASFYNPNGQIYGYYGSYVAIDGDIAVIGEHQSKGKVFVYSRSQGVWSQVTVLYDTTSGPDDYHFGSSVAIDGSTIVVGEYYKTINGNDGQGQAFIYVGTEDPSETTSPTTTGSGPTTCGSYACHGVTDQCCHDTFTGYRCYNPAHYACATLSNGEHLLCPAGLLACNRQCYSTSSYACYTNANGREQLCPINTQLCGTACYNTSLYKCENGALKPL